MLLGQPPFVPQSPVVTCGFTVLLFAEWPYVDLGEMISC